MRRTIKNIIRFRCHDCARRTWRAMRVNLADPKNRNTVYLVCPRCSKDRVIQGRSIETEEPR